MTGRERIQALLNKGTADRVGFWLGNPADETKKIYSDYFNIPIHDDNSNQSTSRPQISKIVKADIELHAAFGSDFYWVFPARYPGFYNHPQGKPIFDFYGGTERKTLSQPGVFAECESVAEIEAFDWPNPDYLDFSYSKRVAETAISRDMAVFSGMWAPFFHEMCDFFGMENYFMKMYTHPAVIQAATERILDFYLQANQRCFECYGDQIDAVFFGNDLGSQRNPLISPDALRQFVLPGFRKIVDQAKSYGLKVSLHSCGAISSIIPDLIDMGIDALHPLQANAANMDAESLTREYKNKIIFLGGVDTQDLLPFQSPEAVSKEVQRLKKIFGKGFIVSPSHETLLPNVSIKNALAMRDAALG